MKPSPLYYSYVKFSVNVFYHIRGICGDKSWIVFESVALSNSFLFVSYGSWDVCVWKSRCQEAEGVWLWVTHIDQEILPSGK